jgi:ferritin-like metal-binding protein YciE
MTIHSFEELFMDEMRDMYDAENRIVKALPKMIEAATSVHLKSALQSHFEETKMHVTRLEQCFQAMDESPGRTTCPAIKGILSEGDDLVGSLEDTTLKDAGIIAACQKVEHYEIATYGTLREWAKLLGQTQVASILQMTLDEEGSADKKLTDISTRLNVVASHKVGKD